MSKHKIGPGVQAFIDKMEAYSEAQKQLPLGERNIYPTGISSDMIVSCVMETLFPDFCVTDPISASQVRTIFLDAFLYKYNKGYRKYVKERNSK